MLKKPVFTLLLSSLFLIGCSNDEAIEVESEEPVKVTEENENTGAAKVIEESVELYGDQMIKEIETNGYFVELVDEYGIVEINKTENATKFTIKENGEEYEDLCSSSYCKYVSYKNSILEFDDVNRINKIILVKDSSGKEVNPFVLPFVETTAQNIANEIEKEFNDEITERVNESKTIRIGMTQTEVLERWGKPMDINRTTTATRTDEQWVYPDYQYAYFEDGILVTIQD